MEVLLEDIIDSIKEEVDQERLQTIVESIKEKGMLHPVAVHKMNGKYNLIAGKKRLMAHQQLGLETIRIEIIGEEGMSEDACHEFRLHENIKRANLPWYEEVKLVKELHELRQRQKGIPDPKSGPVKTGWSLRDTAIELQKALGQVSQDITIAREVERDPTLKNVTDKKTALRLIKQKVKRMDQEETQGLKLVDVEPNQVYCGPAADVLKQFPDAFIDATITDPPWIEFREKRLTKDDKTWPVFKELYRVMKLDSFLIMTVGVEDFIFYRENLPTLGFNVQGHPNIWYKTSGLISYGVRPWEFQRNLELIVVAAKGNPTLVRSTQQSCIWECPVVTPALLKHPNEKPVPLVEKMISCCTYDGAFILDPFGGSGVSGEAAVNLKRRYIIIEREKETYDNICKRLGQAT
jgi:ParB-like chromosome segregation protein Spo0J